MPACDGRCDGSEGTPRGGAVRQSRRKRWRAAAALLAVALSACAHTAARTSALESLADRWPVMPAQAWVVGRHRLSLIVPGAAGPERFRAVWKHGGLDEHGYRFRSAALEPADLHPEEDERPGRARTVQILGSETWTAFAHQFGEQLAPERFGTATLLQVGGNDLLLFRGEGGEVRVTLARDAPASVHVVKRLNLVEVANDAARFMASESARRGVKDSLFLFVLPPSQRGGGLVLFDTSQRLCVALTLPRPFGPRREGSPLGRHARSVMALTIEAHGLALIKNPVSSFGRALSIFIQWIATLATRGQPSVGEPVAPLVAAAPMNLRAWERDLDDITGTRPDRGSVRLLINGESYFPVLEQRIREATESIAMRVNIFDNDDVALRVADLLRARSGEVRVRVVMDELATLVAGSVAPETPMPEDLVLPASIWRYLESGSRVSARAFLNPWLSSDHSKVFVFDRRRAHLGGMNIGRAYRYEWHDMMVELEGPIVGRFAKDFERAWAHASLLGDLAYAAAGGATTQRFAGESERADYVDVRALYTRTGNPQLYGALMRAAKRARSFIWVENPYLYENSFVKQLVAARRRGVDVRVVMPSGSDQGLGDSSNMVTANALLANGVRVYVYPGMTHVKAAVFDGWACLGSANFNKLSLRRNIETNIATSDARVVGVLLRDLFERDFADSHELTEPVAITGGDRFAEWVMSGF